MKITTILAGALILTTPLVASAANADHPYQNVDHRNDAGNNTGDPQVAQLNQAQLDNNGIPASSYMKAPAPMAAAAPTSSTMPARPTSTGY